MVICFLAVALALVPQPKDVELLGGTRVSSVDEIERAVAAFGRDDALPDEAYRFVVAATGVNVWASSSAGAFYAGVTLRQLMDDEGLPVKGSEKRSIYFTRGNTAVGVFTDNPAFNVLPAARAIDKLLVEGMRKAGEPLTKEQDYLKEDAEKK